MTTVATDGRTLAVDSQWTGQFSCPGGMSKVLYHDGHIYGACGVDSSIYKFFEWVKAGQPPERPMINMGEADMSAIELTPTGRLFIWYSDLTRVPGPIPYALGSGGGFAMAAMLSGKDPRAAVKIAAQLDPHTGGAVKVYEVVKSRKGKRQP